ncbi:hypothetical protein GCM10010174_02920 [Kutzneria viridogrisea]
MLWRSWVAWQGVRMTAQAALRAALREVVAPAARHEGFRGSAPTWRMTNALGDWAVVSVQTSRYSTASSLHCVLNTAVAPAPWLAWQQQSLGSLPQAVPESLGLYRRRLHPTGTPAARDGWWEITGDDDARTAATDMVTQLATDGWPILRQLLHREAMLDQIRCGDLGFLQADHSPAYFARAEALLLAELGPSLQLDQALTTATQNTAPTHQNQDRAFADWVRARTTR